MNLIKCPMCEKEVSPNAKKCPHCGEPLKKKKTLTPKINKKFIILGIVLLILLVAFITIRVKFKTTFNMLKIRRYLIKENYKCDNPDLFNLIKWQNITCTIEEDKIKYEIDVYYKQDLKTVMRISNLEKKNDNNTWESFVISNLSYDNDIPKNTDEFEEQSQIPTGWIKYEEEYEVRGKTKTRVKETTCTYYPDGSRIKIGKDLSFDYLGLDDFTDSNISSYDEQQKQECTSYTKNINSFKEEFENIYKETGLKLGQ